MLRLAGVKSYFSAGMASAASTTFFSYWLTWRSTSTAKLFMACGAGCACGAGAAAGAPPVACPNPLAAKLRKTKRRTNLTCLISRTLLFLTAEIGGGNDITDGEIAGIARHRRH